MCPMADGVTIVLVCMIQKTKRQRLWMIWPSTPALAGAVALHTELSQPMFSLKPSFRGTKRNG